MTEELPRWKKGLIVVLLSIILVYGSLFPIGPIEDEGPWSATMPIRFNNDSGELLRIEIYIGSPVSKSYCEAFDVTPFGYFRTILSYTTLDPLVINGTCWEVPKALAVDLYNGFWNITIQELIER